MQPSTTVFTVRFLRPCHRRGNVVQVETKSRLLVPQERGTSEAYLVIAIDVLKDNLVRQTALQEGRHIERNESLSTSKGRDKRSNTHTTREKPMLISDSLAAHSLARSEWSASCGPGAIPGPTAEMNKHVSTASMDGELPKLVTGRGNIYLVLCNKRNLCQHT